LDTKYEHAQTCLSDFFFKFGWLFWFFLLGIFSSGDLHYRFMKSKREFLKILYTKYEHAKTCLSDFFFSNLGGCFEILLWQLFVRRSILQISEVKTWIFKNFVYQDLLLLTSYWPIPVIEGGSEVGSRELSNVLPSTHASYWREAGCREHHNYILVYKIFKNSGFDFRIL